jgi:hypothetical protein
MKSKEESRNEMAAIGTLFLLAFIIGCCIIATIVAIFGL